MRTLLFILMGATAIASSAVLASGRDAAPQDDAPIRATLAAYAAALNGGKASDVVPLYTSDGVLMAPFSQPCVGADAIRATYVQGFREMKFNVKFTVREVVRMSPTFAFARTSSEGTMHHTSTGRTTPEANHELFIMRKASDGRWRIARYSFSPTGAPPPG